MIIDNDKKGRIMVNKCFVPHEGIIYVFHEKVLYDHNRKTVLSSCSFQYSWLNEICKYYKR